MYSEVGQEIIQKTEWLKHIETIGIVITIVLFIFSCIVFFRLKIYKSIDYFFGFHKKREMNRRKKTKELFFMVILCVLGTFSMKIDLRGESIELDSKINEEKQAVFTIQMEEGYKRSDTYKDHLFYNKASRALIRISANNFFEENEKTSFKLEVICEKMKNGEIKERSKVEYTKSDFSAFENTQYRSLEKSKLTSQENDGNVGEVGIYEKYIDFPEEKGAELIYSFRLRYIDSEGIAMVPEEGDREEDRKDVEEMDAGYYIEDTFQSKKIVIDSCRPVLSGDFNIEPVSNMEIKEGTVFYDGGIEGEISVEEEYLSEENMNIRAIPLDWAARAAAEENKESGDEKTFVITEWHIKKNKGVYKVDFTFSKEGKWKLECYCKDVSGNQSRKENGGEGEIEVCSDVFIIDTKAPLLEVTYSDLRRIASCPREIDSVNNEIVDEEIINSGKNEIYISGKSICSISIEENNFDLSEISISIFQYNYEKEIKKDITDEVLKNVTWKQQENKAQLCVEFMEEGHYQVQAACKDPAGHECIAVDGSETDNCMTGGLYTGPLCTLDITEPKLEVSFDKDSAAYNVGLRYYYNQNIDIIIKVKEENFNCGDFQIKDSMYYADGKSVDNTNSDHNYIWKCTYEDGIRVNQLVISVNQEANHTFNIQAEDGTRSFHTEAIQRITVDKKVPIVEYKIKEMKDENSTLPIRLIPYFSYQYFSNKNVLVQITAHDEISGVRFIYYEGIQDEKNVTGIKENTLESPKKDQSIFTAYVILDAGDFKGRLHVNASDYSGNQSEQIHCKGIIQESEKTHNKVSSIHFTMEKAFYTDERRKVRYYNHSLKVISDYEDTYSGLYGISLEAKNRYSNEDADNTFQNEAIRQYFSKFKDIVYRKRKELLIPGEVFKSSSRENDIRITAQLEDNAGNTTLERYKDYKVVIDDTRPVIDVKYMKCHVQNGKYYNQSRIAVVTVTDWNFNPKGVKWDIKGSNQEYQIGAWLGSGQKHWCRVRFHGEGDDYRIRLTVKDYAGNQSIWDKDTVFSIDKTPPVIELERRAVDQEDNSQDQEGKIQNQKEKNTLKEFSNQSQNVIIKIKEKHFTDRNLAYTVKGVSEGKTIFKSVKKNRQEETDSEEKMSIQNQKNKTSEEDVYVKEMVLKKEGTYTFSVKCTDQAGNTSKKVYLSPFTIDKTKPEIRIEHVEKGSTYIGKVDPTVYLNDLNLEEDTVDVTLKRLDGKRKRKKDFPFTVNKRKRGESTEIQVQWDDFSKEAWVDGIYQLKVVAKDKAGNENRLKKDFVFYVNRFGTVFEIDDATMQYLRQGYMNQEKDICIRERCVNDTETELVLIKDNQTRKRLEEAADYTTSILKHKDYEWKEKEYHINKELFKEEGKYVIVLVSKSVITDKNGEKRIIKQVDNRIKESPIEFVIDKTGPSVKISGLDQKTYLERKHEFTITAIDNMNFRYLDVMIHYVNRYGAEKRKDRKLRLYAKDFDEMHSYTGSLESYNGYQIVSYEAVDYAGNIRTSSMDKQEKKCVITNNRVIHEIYKYSFAWSLLIAGVAISIIIGAVIIAIRRNIKL